jgi:hypothetical protein
VYDPRELVKSYKGERDISPDPTHIIDWPVPAGYLTGRIAGVAQDPDDPHILHIMHTFAYHSGVKFYPVVHKYRIKAR